MRPDMIGPRKLRPAGSFGEPLFQMTREDPHRVLKGVVEPMIVRGQVNGVMPGAAAAPKPQPALWVVEKARPEVQVGSVHAMPFSGDYTFIKKPESPVPHPGEFSGEEGSTAHRHHLMNQYRHAVSTGNHDLAEETSMEHEGQFGSALNVQGSKLHREWQKERHGQTGEGRMFTPKMRHGEGGVSEPKLGVRGQRYLGQTGKETGGSGQFQISHPKEWGPSTFRVKSPEHFKETLSALRERGYEMPKTKPAGVGETAKGNPGERVEGLLASKRKRGALEEIRTSRIKEEMSEAKPKPKPSLRERVFGKAQKEVIPGGLAEGKPDSDFDPEQLMDGMRVEMEHSGDPKKAREIAKDHLAEDKDYYKKLAKMEAKKAIQGQQPIMEKIGTHDPVAGTHFPRFGTGDDIHVDTAKHEIQADHFSRQKGGALRSQFHARSAAKLRALGGSPTLEHRKQAFRELPPQMGQLMRAMDVLMSKAKEHEKKWVPPTEYGPEAYGKPAHPEGHGAFSGEPIEKVKERLAKQPHRPKSTGQFNLD